MRPQRRKVRNWNKLKLKSSLSGIPINKLTLKGNPMGHPHYTPIVNDRDKMFKKVHIPVTQKLSEFEDFSYKFGGNQDMYNPPPMDVITHDDNKGIANAISNQRTSIGRPTPPRGRRP